MFFSIAFGLLFGLFFSLLVGLIKPRWVCFPNRISLLKGMGIVFILIIILGAVADGTKNEHQLVNLISFVIGFLVLFVLDIKLDISDKDEKPIQVNFKMTVTKTYDDNDLYEVDQYIDDIPIYAKKTKNIKKTQEDDDKDSFEGWFYDEVPDYIDINKNLQIKYKDANNKTTDRPIRVRKFGKANFGGFLLSHCHLREESRTFRTDRIVECIDKDTGEIIHDVSAYLLESYKSTPEYKRKVAKEKDADYYEEFIKKYDVLLKVISYIVKCDGTYNAKEKAIVKEIFEGLEKDNVLMTDKMLTKVFKEIPFPTLRSFKLNLTKLINDNKFNFDVLMFTENVIATQRSIHDREAELLEYFEERFQIDDLISRVNERVKGVKAEQKEYFKSGKVCPNCKSDHVTKKGQRVLKKGKIQRYQCQGCEKVFSESIE